MNRYEIDRQAIDDIRSIYRHIACENVSAAENTVARIYAVFDLLITQREMGQRRDDLLPGVRAMTCGNYVILFKPADYGIDVLQIVHAAQDMKSAFRNLSLPES
jgi:toxin ParE1/3/4